MGSGRVIAEGGGRPRWGVVMVRSEVLAGSAIARGESTLGSRGAECEVWV